MKMEQKNLTKGKELVEKENNTPVDIASDNLLDIAREAEGRIEAVNKIKNLSLKVTNSNDWIDERGKPYLQCSGSEKVARLFGISWRISEPILETDNDGHYRYRYKGEFLMKGASIEAVGTRSSKDPFFSRKGGSDVLPEKIDKANVMKGAYTNCIGNGITRLLGIRNLTWEELNAVGIKPSGKVESKSKAQKAAGSGKITDKQKDMMKKLMKQLDIKEETYLGDKKIDDLTIAEASEMINDLLAQTKENK